jgi:hypothetical protein
MRIPLEEDNESERDIGLLQRGRIFRYSKKETMDEREEKKNVFEKRDPRVVLHITLYKERKEK